MSGNLGQIPVELSKQGQPQFESLSHHFLYLSSAPRGAGEAQDTKFVVFSCATGPVGFRSAAEDHEFWVKTRRDSAAGGDLSVFRNPKNIFIGTEQTRVGCVSYVQGVGGLEI